MEISEAQQQIYTRLVFQQKKFLAKSKVTVLKVTQIQECACNIYIKSDNARSDFSVILIHFQSP